MAKRKPARDSKTGRVKQRRYRQTETCTEPRRHFPQQPRRRVCRRHSRSIPAPDQLLETTPSANASPPEF